VICVDFDGADVDGFGEGEEGEDEGEGDEGDCYVVDHSPWMVDCDQTDVAVSTTFEDTEGESYPEIIIPPDTPETRAQVYILFTV